MDPSLFRFTVEARAPGALARAGTLWTPHGAIETPVFMPVGTQATVKTLTPRDLVDSAVQILLANAYHLTLRPGAEALREHGGLHQFMGWSRPLLTDSGGFQIFSLANPRRREGAQGSLVKVTDEGVWFTSPIDGSRQFISPERSVDVQTLIGADIIMALDECSRDNNDEEEAERSLRRTHAWLERCVARWHEQESNKHDQTPQALFGIIQGGNSRRLREESARFVAGLDLSGVAVGGESIGYSRSMTATILDWIGPLLPHDRPHYAMGVGDPESFFMVVRRGIDMFDCVLPTRLARHGTLFTRRGRLRLESAAWMADSRPPDSSCDCYTCRSFSRAYLRHLFKAEEALGPHLATVHNVHFCVRLVRDIRSAIIQGRLDEYEQEFLETYQGGVELTD